MGRKRKKSIAPSPSSSKKKKKVDTLESKTTKNKTKQAKTFENIQQTTKSNDSTIHNDNDTIRNNNNNDGDDADAMMEEKQKEKDATLQHAVTFLERTTSTTNNNSNTITSLLPFYTNERTPDSKDEQNQHHLKKTPKEQFIKRCTTSSMITSTTALSTYLTEEEETATTPPTSLLKKQDVAFIILPWAISYLLRSSQKEEDGEEMVKLAWEVLNNSLTVLSSSFTERLATLLSQSVCNKLLLLALTSIMEKDDNNNNKNGIIVECYIHLGSASISRPRLDDFIMDQLFPLIHSLLFSSTTDKVTTNKVISSTLKLLAKVAGIKQVVKGENTVMSGTTNPKRVYNLLSTPSTLCTLAKICVFLSTTEDDDDDDDDDDEEDKENGLELCQQILWSTFFDPMHHLDGFKFMNMSVPVVKLELLQDDDDDDDDDDDAKEKSEEKEGGEDMEIEDEQEEEKEEAPPPDLSKMSKRQRKRYRREQEEKKREEKKKEEERLKQQLEEKKRQEHEKVEKQQEEDTKKKLQEQVVCKMEYPLSWGKRQNYQQNLFTAIYTLVLNNDSSKKKQDETTTATAKKQNENFDNQNVIVTIQIIPILIEGFIYQTKMKQQQHHEKHTTTTTKKVVADWMQLTFSFWCNLIQPLLLRLKQQQGLKKKDEDSDLQHCILQSLQKSTLILLKYNVYSPNNDDSDETNYKFLSWVMETMLNYILGSSSSDGFSKKEEQKKKVEVLKLFQYLLECNHHLIQNNLSTVLLFSSSCLSSSSSFHHPISLSTNEEKNKDTVVVSEAASALVSLLITTYSKLRQIGHLISSILDILPSSSSSSNEGGEKTSQTKKKKKHSDIMMTLRHLLQQQHGVIPHILSKMLQDTNIIQVFSSSIRNCPPGQTKSIWNIYTRSIQNIIKPSTTTTTAKSEEEEEKEQNIAFIIELFILFLRSVKVDRYSAHEIMSLCDSTMKTLVSSFMMIHDKNDDGTVLQQGGAFVKYGLYLCSWLVDLHIRCCFWLNRSHTEASKSFLLKSSSDDNSEDDDDDEQNNDVLSFLLGVAKFVVVMSDGEKSTAGDNLLYQGIELSHDVIKALQRLACHRIQQLHSMIYQMEQLDDDDDDDDDDDETSFSKYSKSKNAASLKEEAEILVDFCVYSASTSSQASFSYNTSRLKKEEDNDNNNNKSNKEKENQTKDETIHESKHENSFFSGGKSSWTILAQSIATWAPYSKPCHIRSFLRWMYSAASTVSTTATNDKITTSLLFMTTNDGKVNDSNDIEGKYSPLSSNNMEDQTVALSLVRDATFYEIPQVSDEALSVGLLLVVHLVRHGVNNDELCNTFIIQHHDSGKRSSTADLISEESWKPFDGDEWMNVLDPVKRMALTSTLQAKAFNGTSCLPLLKRASHLIKILNGMPEDFLMKGTSKTKHHNLDKLLRTEMLTRFLILGGFLSSKMEIITAVEIGCACREAIGKLMIHSAHDNKDCPLLDTAFVLKMFLKDTYRYSEEVMKGECNYLVELDKDHILTSINGVVGAVLHACVEKFEVDSEPMVSFIEVLDEITSHESETTDDMAELMKMKYMRAVIKTLNVHTSKDRNVLSRWNEQSDLKLQDLCSQTIGCFRSNMFNLIAKNLILAGKQLQLDDKAKQKLLPEMILVLSDVLRFWSFQGANDPQKPGMSSDAIISRNVSDAFNSIINILLKKEVHFLYSAVLKSSASYFLCTMSEIAADFCECVTSESALVHILKVMRNMFVSHNMQDPMLDSSFCGILQLADGREIQMVNRFLLDNLSEIEKASERDKKIAFVVHTFQIMLLGAKGQEQRNELSNTSQKILLLLLELLTPHYQTMDDIDMRAWLYRLDIGTQCLLHLIRMNDVLRLNSRNISVILCQVNSLLTLCPQRGNGTEGGMTVDAQVFSCCCTILSSLLKHHPKQLYGCAPTLFCVLSSLWTYAMHVRPHQQTDLSASQKMYELTKLFEALTVHKQIFKKHVVGLLLIFVDALEKGMSPSIKQSLMPSAFCLLDMCSKFELRQVNMLMNKTSRPLFSAVYQSYQKLQYKGQF